MFSALAAAALAASQPADTPFSNFDSNVQGWSIVRRPDGCFAFTVGTRAFNVYYRAVPGEQALRLMFTDSEWALPQQDLDDYRIVYSGTGANWNGLAGGSFPGREAGDISFISVSFNAGAIAAMLEDISAGRGVTLDRPGSGPIFAVPYANAPRAMSRLLDCVRTVTRETVPPPAEQ